MASCCVFCWAVVVFWFAAVWRMGRAERRRREHERKRLARRVARTLAGRWVEGWF